MKRFTIVMAAAVLMAGWAWPGGSSSAGAATAGRYIVVLKDNVSSPSSVADEHARRYGAQVGFVYSNALNGYSAVIPNDRVVQVRSDSRVAFISEDRTVEAVGTTPIVTGDSAPTGVRRIEAATADSSTTPPTMYVHQVSSVGVAVIDTGINLTHPDLNAVNGKNCVRKNRTANDDNGHGSHVAGTIAARNNGSGVVGVAPGTTLYAVKVLSSSGSGTWGQVICGIDWVTARRAEFNDGPDDGDPGINLAVANMSLGGSGSNDNNCGNTNGDALHKAICNSTNNAGVTYVVAAGNSATNFSGFVPAAYPEALTVTAMSDSDGLPGGTGVAPTCRTGEADDAYATFSNYAVAMAEVNHTVAGPGVCIYSTWKNGAYTTISGTSMASPHVAGTVALCITSGLCTGTPAQIIQQIRSDAQAHATATNGFLGDPSSPVAGRVFGYLAWAGGY